MQGDRLNRALFVHGFLLAAYGLLVQARISAAKCIGPVGDCPADAVPYMEVVLLLTSVMLPVIGAMGILTTLSAQKGVRAAKQAIISIRDKWSAFDTEDLGIRDVGLPGLTGGGDDDVNQRGEGSSKGYLRYLLYLWLLIFALSIYGAIGHLKVQNVMKQIGVEMPAAVKLH